MIPWHHAYKHDSAIIRTAKLLALAAAAAATAQLSLRTQKSDALNFVVTTVVRQYCVYYEI